MNKLREVTFHDLFRKDRKKRTLSIYEEFKKGGYLCLAERKAIFRLKEVRLFANINDAGSYIEQKLSLEDSLRQLSVLRIYNEKTDVNFWRSKLVSSVYVMYDNVVFTVLSMQILKVSIQKEVNKV
jgi:hypothetical protein